ncbi:hypothetical protein FB562_2205 [Homoserinimonas aerilata]|uniref:Acb2/Tad1 hairpin domain-containing protein n=1 Tax=Homoserinimonas aerilata TaxID=1162970 RepID=A0A542YF33_9MICO|nr:hypothetical protein [Homoserinimonas aerilata]TQL46681.1 hypothetical protein FB562_2205 [Homoserinimonas aerilata]
MAESTKPTPLEERFMTAAGGNPPTEDQKHAVAKMQEAIVQVASHIHAYVPGGRNQSLALTALEDVQMRANRGIFATGPSA